MLLNVYKEKQNKLQKKNLKNSHCSSLKDSHCSSESCRLDSWVKLILGLNFLERSVSLFLERLLTLKDKHIIMPSDMYKKANRSLDKSDGFGLFREYILNGEAAGISWIRKRLLVIVLGIMAGFFRKNFFFELTLPKKKWTNWDVNCSVGAVWTLDVWTLIN